LSRIIDSRGGRRREKVERWEEMRYEWRREIER